MQMLDELATLPIGSDFIDIIKNIVAGAEVSELRDSAKNLILYVENHIRQKKDKNKPSEALRVTYEEIYSNWRNKVEEASDNNNSFAYFMNMCNLHYMFKEISSEFAIGDYNIMEEYDPDSLENNIKLFDNCLQKYSEVYKSAGIKIKRYQIVDEFVSDYLDK